MKCRLCDHPLSDIFIDLGSSPPSNAYLSSLGEPETWLPLTVYVCSRCLLVQLPEHETPENIFAKNYPYLSGVSKSWVAHADRFVAVAVERYNPKLVVEVASNDGTVLQAFKRRNCEVIGIEPATNVAAVAEKNGIPTVCEFLGARSGGRMNIQADLVHAANVFAHVPDLHDFIDGLKAICAPGGVITLEFPSVMVLIEKTLFDTIYHEHFSYFSLHTAAAALRKHGLEVFDVEHLTTHGGSLRLHVARKGRLISDAVVSAVHTERSRGHEVLLTEPSILKSFRERVLGIKRRLLRKLLDTEVVGFGAPAKATTLLNYCGVKPDMLAFTTDDNPMKQGKYMPGSRIPIRPVSALHETDATVLILPCNIKEDALQRVGPRPVIYP